MSGNDCEQRKRKGIIRAVVRTAVCAAAAAAAWPHEGPAWQSGIVPALSPFNALLAIAAGAGALLSLGSLAAAVASVFSPRVFCRWICPAGTCQDAVSCRLKKRTWIARVPRIGAWLVFIGLGAALAGYPLFGWLDPLTLFNAAFGAVRKDIGTLDYIAAAGFPVLLLLALIAPGLWCGRLCPLGAMQDLLRLPLRLRNGSAPDAKKETSALSRRAFLGLGLGAGYRIALPPGTESAPAVIRPPVTGHPSRFTRLCVRCGACVRACPSGIIRFGGSESGWSRILAPEIVFGDDYCPTSCTACGEACPTGAIHRFTPEQKAAQPMGVVRVNRNTCLLGEGRECGSCVSVCPHGALDLAWDPKEMESRIVVNPRTCTGCGYCEYVCPSVPHSIRVWPRNRRGCDGGGQGRQLRKKQHDAQKPR